MAIYIEFTKNKIVIKTAKYIYLFEYLKNEPIDFVKNIKLNIKHYFNNNEKVLFETVGRIFLYAMLKVKLILNVGFQT